MRVTAHRETEPPNLGCGYLDDTPAILSKQAFQASSRRIANAVRWKVELCHMDSMTDHRWTTDGPDILAKERLELTRQALSADWTVGIHFFYCAGCGGKSVAFSQYDPFFVHVAKSRPGDLFILWSVAELRRRALLLLDNRYVDAAKSGESLLSTWDFDRVEKYLANRNSTRCFAYGVRVLEN